MSRLAVVMGERMSGRFAAQMTQTQQNKFQQEQRCVQFGGDGGGEGGGGGGGEEEGAGGGEVVGSIDGPYEALG